EPFPWAGADATHKDEPRTEYVVDFTDKVVVDFGLFPFAVLEYQTGSSSDSFDSHYLEGTRPGRAVFLAINEHLEVPVGKFEIHALKSDPALVGFLLPNRRPAPLELLEFGFLPGRLVIGWEDPACRRTGGGGKHTAQEHGNSCGQPKHVCSSVGQAVRRA